MVTLSPENGLPLSYELLRAAQLCGADCIAAACPMCQMNLDLRQEEIKKKYKADFNLPIYYFTELMALSFGASPKEIGLQKHFVESVSLVAEIGRKETA